LSGSTDAGVYLAENTAGKGRIPELKPFKAIIFPAGKEWERGGGKAVRETDLKRPTYGCRIWAADVNGDGKLDILVGDQTTLAFPKAGISDAEMAKRHAAWQKESDAAQAAYLKAMNNPESAKSDAKSGGSTGSMVGNLFNALGRLLSSEESSAQKKAQEEYMKVYNKRTEFMTEETTGFVWLYLQK